MLKRKKVKIEQTKEDGVVCGRWGVCVQICTSHRTIRIDPLERVTSGQR